MAQRFIFQGLTSSASEWLVTIYDEDTAELAYRPRPSAIWRTPLPLIRTDHDPVRQ